MSELQQNCEWVPVGALIYPDDFEIRKGTRRFAESLGNSWMTTAKANRWQRERSRDLHVPHDEAKILKLMPKHQTADNEVQERLRWEMRKAKSLYAATLGRILKQLEGGM